LFPEPRRQFIDLIKGLNISLGEQKAARANRFKEIQCLAIGFGTLEPENKQLSDLFFESKAMCFFHGSLNTG
jgi:hypothetical protein